MTEQQLLTVQESDLATMRPEARLAALNAATAQYMRLLESDPASTVESPRPMRPKAGREQEAETALTIANAWVDVLTVTHQLRFGGSDGWSLGAPHPPRGEWVVYEYDLAFDGGPIYEDTGAWLGIPARFVDEAAASLDTEAAHRQAFERYTGWSAAHIIAWDASCTDEDTHRHPLPLAQSAQQAARHAASCALCAPRLLHPEPFSFDPFHLPDPARKALHR
jgi:hypothetical protein